VNFILEGAYLPPDICADARESEVDFIVKQYSYSNIKKYV
jgi:hypothetical protein